MISLATIILGIATGRRDHPVYVPLDFLIVDDTVAHAADGTGIVTFGLAIPRHSRVRDVDELVLAGAPDVQFHVRSRWSTGAIQWVTVDAAVDFSEEALPRTLLIATGDGRPAAKTGIARRSGRTIIVDNGTMRFTLVESSDDDTPAVAWTDFAIDGRSFFTKDDRGVLRDDDGIVQGKTQWQIVRNGALCAVLEGRVTHRWADTDDDTTSTETSTASSVFRIEIRRGERRIGLSHFTALDATATNANTTTKTKPLVLHLPFTSGAIDVPLSPVRTELRFAAADQTADTSPTVGPWRYGYLVRPRDQAWWNTAQTTEAKILAPLVPDYYHKKQRVPLRATTSERAPDLRRGERLAPLCDVLRSPADRTREAFAAVRRSIEAALTTNDVDPADLGATVLWSHLFDDAATEAAWRRASDNLSTTGIDGFRATVEAWSARQDEATGERAWKSMTDLRDTRTENSDNSLVGSFDNPESIDVVLAALDRLHAVTDCDADRGDELLDFAETLAFDVMDHAWSDETGRFRSRLVRPPSKPDAGADAVPRHPVRAEHAFIWAYRLTGDDAYLRRAKRWLAAMAKRYGTVVPFDRGVTGHDLLQFVQNQTIEPVWRDLDHTVSWLPGRRAVLSFRVPAGADALRAKHARRDIVDSLGYDSTNGRTRRSAADHVTFAAADNLTGEPDPATDGSDQRLEIVGLADRDDHAFALRYLETPPRLRRRDRAPGPRHAIVRTTSAESDATPPAFLEPSMVVVDDDGPSPEQLAWRIRMVTYTALAGAVLVLAFWVFLTTKKKQDKGED